jgi:hypothetical protein
VDQLEEAMAVPADTLDLQAIADLEVARREEPPCGTVLERRRQLNEDLDVIDDKIATYSQG